MWFGVVGCAAADFFGRAATVETATPQSGFILYLLLHCKTLYSSFLYSTYPIHFVL
jgi:hypothetical protein